MSANYHLLQSIVVELRAATPGNPPATLGRAIHALVLNWINSSNEQLAATIHDGQVSPWSLSGLFGHRRSRKNLAGDHFYFRIGILDSQLIQPLLMGITLWGMQPIVLGNFPFVMTRVYASPDGHPLSALSGYEILATATPGQADIYLEFVSPTSFKQKQVVQTFPLPDLVFSNLLRRWNTFAPAELQFAPVEWQGFVAAYDLKTHALKLEGSTEIGAQGWVRYRFHDEEQTRIANILARFAFFAGVGRKTTMGMGQTHVMIEGKVK
jgi:CRISPR-associated endoribonuclease Cas6